MSLLGGAVDTHVHAAPDLVERHQSDLELAAEAAEAGMAGVVIKNHVEPTVGRAALANEAIGEDILYGGVVLNGAVGGVNPDAAEMALELGAKVVWLPTLWAANDARGARLDGNGEGGDAYKRGQRIPTADEEITVSREGSVTGDVRRAVELVAEHEAVLATGHVSYEETAAIARACADLGADCLVNHPFSRHLDAGIDGHLRLADLGATMEYCALSLGKDGGPGAGDVAEALQRVGPARCVLASDYGQVGNPPVGGLEVFANEVIEAGATAEDVRTAVSETPTRLLGI